MPNRYPGHPIVQRASGYVTGRVEYPCGTYIHRVEFAENCLFERYGIMIGGSVLRPVVQFQIFMECIWLSLILIGFGCIASFRFIDVYCVVFLLYIPWQVRRMMNQSLCTAQSCGDSCSSLGWTSAELDMTSKTILLLLWILCSMVRIADSSFMNRWLHTSCMQAPIRQLHREFCIAIYSASLSLSFLTSFTWHCVKL